MAISAKEVQALRQKTGAGMMDCKNALTEAEGDFNKAMNILREKGLARARKRSEKSADEGLIRSHLSDDTKVGVLLELNCETDFVARTSDFQNLAGKLSQAIAELNLLPDGWADLILDGDKASVTLDSLSLKLGEKIQLRRFERFQADDGFIEVYIHAGARLGVMLEYQAEGDAGKAREIAHNLTMQIAASSPSFLKREEVPSETLEKELEIYRAQARNEGKPEHLVDRIAQGKTNKFYQDVCLLEQPFIKEQKTMVSQYLSSQAKASQVKVEPTRFVRFALGGN
ncbi:MAG: elongation factor Ts [candidate division Zixibacteria bacterium]|nr:elongation factor Ts [Candidatus Tariuqbacter arcticus]